MTVAADGRRPRRRQCATLPAPSHSNLLSTPLRTHRMDIADFLWPTPTADRFNAPRWNPETVASWGGGFVTCGRVLDATVHSSRDTVANGDRSNALPRHKVHGLSLQFSKKPDASTQAFRTAAKAAPANESAEQDGEERSDSPNRAENGGQGPHPPFSAR